MANKSAESQTGVEEQEDATPKKPRFRDTWQGFAVFIVALLVLRFLVFEPFKIPTGSMEPTLIGHEDHGDRIVTNKMAYYGGTNPVAFFGGEPKRFDVFVFVHDSAWQRPKEEGVRVTDSLKRNYIKRVVGLPGETIIVSGGDLFLQEGGKERILRKWESSEALQESLWQPVSVADLQWPVEPEAADELQRKIYKQKQARAFPWDSNGAEKAAWPQGQHAVRLTGPTTLTYRHPATNLYVKVGRWPFFHWDCPAANVPGIETESGTVLRNPNKKSEDIAPYLPDFWSGVECPNCGQVRFPMVAEKSPAQVEDPEQPRIFPNADMKGIDPRAFWSSEPDFNASKGYFFYGGQHVVGDLKLEVELEVEESGGALELEVGSNLHRAAWCLSLGETCPTPEADPTRHDVPGQTSLSPGRKHLITLAYVDGSVLSSLDGVKNEPLKIEVRPADAAVIESLVRLRLHGKARVKITRLNLYRDLYHMIKTDKCFGNPVVKLTNDYKGRQYDPVRQRFQFDIPENKFLAMGDNSPSSVDSREWGFVPRKNLVGRASFIFWPPSRWRIIR